MMWEQIRSMPAWVVALGQSMATLLLAWLIGQFLMRTVCRRLSAWASQTTWKWDAPVIETVRRGLPLWSVLIGCSLTMSFWRLPPDFLATVHRLTFVLIWISVTLLCARLTGKLIVLYGSQFHPEMPATSLTEQIVKILITILGLLMILHSLGISIAPLLTALGVGGVALALALQDTLSNLFAGFYLTVARQIHVGDYIRLESGQEGRVEDIGWRATTIRTPPDHTVIVPNNTLNQSTITNYDLPNRELMVTVEAGVAYDSDLARVERVTLEVARQVLQSVPGAVAQFEPLIRYHTLGEFGVNFTVLLRAKSFLDQSLITHEFIKRLLPRYRQEGLAIPCPTEMLLRNISQRVQKHSEEG